MSKFLTHKDIINKLELGDALNPEDKYLTKSQVVSTFSNTDYDETVLNNVKGDNYFVTDDDIVKSPRHALLVIFADEHVKSATISVSDNSIIIPPLLPTSDNESDDNVSPSSVFDKVDGGNFIKKGNSKTITETSIVYIPDGAKVGFSSTHTSGYQKPTYPIIQSMGEDQNMYMLSNEIRTSHQHNGYAGTVNVTIIKHDDRDSISYQVCHVYNGSICTIQMGYLNSSSTSFETPTFGAGTRILFAVNNASSLSDEYEIKVDKQFNVTTKIFDYANSSLTGLKSVGPSLALTSFTATNWTLNITIK